MNKKTLISDYGFESLYKSFENIELKFSSDIIQNQPRFYKVSYELSLGDKSLHLIDNMTTAIHTKDSLLLAISFFFVEFGNYMNFPIQTLNREFNKKIDPILKEQTKLKQNALYKNIKGFLGDHLNSFIQDCHDITQNHTLGSNSFAMMYMPVHILDSYLEENSNENK